MVPGVGGKDSVYWTAACSAAGSAMYGRSWPPGGGSGTVYDAAAPWSMSFPGSASTGSGSHCGAERPGIILRQLTAHATGPCMSSVASEQWKGWISISS